MGATEAQEVLSASWRLACSAKGLMVLRHSTTIGRSAAWFFQRWSRLLWRARRRSGRTYRGPCRRLARSAAQQPELRLQLQRAIWHVQRICPKRTVSASEPAIALWCLLLASTVAIVRPYT